MSRENVEVVRKVYDALGRDWEVVLAAYSAETEWDDRAIRPDGALVRGRTAMRDTMRAWFGTWNDYRWKTIDVIDAGDEVVVVGRERGEGKGSGVTLDQQVALAITVRAGLIVRTRVFTDKTEALEAVGLRE